MDALGINWGFLLSQVVNLAILLIALRLVLYKPVMRMLDQRAQRIKKGLEDAELASKKAAQAEAEYQRRVEQAKHEVQKIIDKAVEQGERARDDIIARAQKEAQELLDKARRQIEIERQDALRAVRTQVADLVVAATAKVVGQSLDARTHRRLIDEFLAESRSENEVQSETQALLNTTREQIELERQEALEAMRSEFADMVIAAATKVIGQSLDTEAHRQLIAEFLAEQDALETVPQFPSEPLALVKTAVPLTSEQKRTILQRLRLRFGQDLQARFKVEPDLLGGVWVHVGDQIIDDSVAGRLAALRNLLVKGESIGSLQQ